MKNVVFWDVMPCGSCKKKIMMMMMDDEDDGGAKSLRNVGS
jgi:hypothetical protein